MNGVICLLAVVQQTKDKVRPVIDYHELNPFIDSHTGDDEIAICADKVRIIQVLSLDDEIHRATDHYIDDIMVKESITSASRVQEHFWKYGHESKEPESLADGRVFRIAL